MQLELDPHERLFIARIRTGKTQKEYALDRYDVSRETYGLWEKGVGRPPKVPGPKTLKRLKKNELCLIFRRREKLTQKQLAVKCGINAFYIRLMEKGHMNCNELLRYWETVGGCSKVSTKV